MKKILSLITAVVLTVGSTTAFAQENGVSLTEETIEVSAQSSGDSFVVGDIKYTELEDGTLEVSCNNMNITKAEIPATVNGKSVTSIGEWAFLGCTSLTSITIPNSVTSISRWAFSDCASLTSVTIPNSVTNIGYDAFRGCTGLTSVTIPNSVTSIGTTVFSGCTRLTAINVNENNGEYCSVNGVLFNKDKTKLEQYPAGKTEKSYTIPNSVTSIGAGAFELCASLTSVTIPNSVTKISYYAFSGCTSLTSVTIPNSVTSIDDGAFSGCTSLTSVTIPNSVTSIDDGAFSGCTSLTAINVNENNVGYCSVNGVLFSKDKTVLEQYPAGKTEKNYTIPNGVTSIGAGAFESCESLTSVTIPNSVTSIGHSVFDGCTSLTSVTIPNGVTSISDYAFDGCESLTSVTIPNSVTSIGYAAFRYCYSLTSITIPNSVTIIGANAFEGCDLTSVTIPNKVTSIGKWAFSGCISLTSVTIPNSVTSIGMGAFDVCEILKDVYYTGTESEWNKISIDSFNDPLLNATIHYSTGPSSTPVDVTIKAPTGVDTSNQTATITVNGETITLPIVDGLLDISGLEEGKTYTITFSAKNCAPRAYDVTVSNGTATGLDKVELNLYGDINGDGNVTLGDVLKANAAARNSKQLTGYEKDVADINGDGNISLGDVLKMNAHARKSKLLW